MKVKALDSVSVANPARAKEKSLQRLLDHYIRFHRIQGSTHDTIKHKKNQLSPFIRWLEEQNHSLDASDVAKFDVLAHLEWLQERGRRPATIDTRLRNIRAWLQWMVDWEILPANPAARIKPPKIPKVRKPFISEASFNALLELCPLSSFLGARRQAVLWTFSTTGMRRRELLMLNLEDLGWDEGIIRVIHGKGQKERQVPFLKEAQRPMLRYLQHRQDDNPKLWVQQSGRDLSYGGLGKDIGMLMERAGIEVVDPCHIFRRTFAANAVRQKIPRPYVQAVAGWSTPTMMDRYTAAMEAESQAIEEFKEKFKPFGASG